MDTLSIPKIIHGALIVPLFNDSQHIPHSGKKQHL
jgi:hypothetical protein